MSTIQPLFTHQISSKASLILPIESNRGALWLGSIAAALDHNFLLQNRIQNVLTISHKCELNLPKNILHREVLIKDIETENIMTHFDDVNKFIEQKLDSGQCVLVHCQAGISRSVAIVVAYIIWKFKKSLSRSLDFVKSKRQSSNPNKGFLTQLKQYELSLAPIVREDKGRNVRRSLQGDTQRKDQSSYFSKSKRNESLDYQTQMQQLQNLSPQCMFILQNVNRVTQRMPSTGTHHYTQEKAGTTKAIPRVEELKFNFSKSNEPYWKRTAYY